jgi:hypothetical protein
MPSPAREIESFSSHDAVVEAFFAESWSDGLPIVPPTPDLVDRMIAAGGRDADHVIGTVAERNASVHVWQAATCAVMAGCRPDYFPVVLATWAAILDPAFNLNTVLSSTGGAAIAAAVSGPYAEDIGMRSGTGLFGPGNRANATIGRAIRLGALTALKAVAGEMDMSSFGHGGKYTFHFAEGISPAGWPPIREQLGFPAESTTVTVMASEAPRQIAHRFYPSATDMLNLVGTTMRDPGQNATGTVAPFIVIWGPEHAGLLANAGLQPRDIRRALSKISAISAEQLAAAGIKHDSPGARYSTRDEDGRFITAKPEHILAMTAGGPGAGWSMVLSGWARVFESHPTTRAVHIPGRDDAERDASRAEIDFA